MLLRSDAKVYRERGATLIVTLIFLLIIVTVSMGGMQTTAMEERMASNTRQRNLAFQSAETGLREAERFIENLADTSRLGTTPGLLAVTDNEPDYFADVTWANNPAASVLVNPGAVNLYILQENPRYIIKYIADNSSGAGARGEPELNPDETDSGEDNIAVFKVVSRGVGGSNSTQVILQSNYGKRF